MPCSSRVEASRQPSLVRAAGELVISHLPQEAEKDEACAQLVFSFLSTPDAHTVEWYHPHQLTHLDNFSQTCSETVSMAILNPIKSTSTITPTENSVLRWTVCSRLHCAKAEKVVALSRRDGLLGNVLSTMI